MLKMKTKLILGIDPGPTTTGVCMFDHAAQRVVWANAKMPNDELLTLCREPGKGVVVGVECIEAMYTHVGKETVCTIRYIGRLEEALHASEASKVYFLSPQKVRQMICGTAAAKDPGVRQALIDNIGVVGTKKNPGPTYGVASHAWRALAVAVATQHPDGQKNSLTPQK